MTGLKILHNWPKVLAHRGACALAPENTIEAFHLARKLGCQGTELDVHLCKTGELVITHDFYLDRVAGIHKKIQETSFAELREFNMSIGFNAGIIPGIPSNKNQSADLVGGIDPTATASLDISTSVPFHTTQIPTLDEVLETMGRDFYLDIELKAEGIYCAELAQKVAECLDRHGHKNCIVSSFNPFAVCAYKKLNREATAGIYCANTTVPWFLRHKEIIWLSRAPILKPSIEIVRNDIKKNENRQRIKRQKSVSASLFKRPTIIWTVDDPSEAQALLTRGASSIITNRVQDFKY